MSCRMPMLNGSSPLIILVQDVFGHSRACAKAPFRICAVAAVTLGGVPTGAQGSRTAAKANGTLWVAGPSASSEGSKAGLPESESAPGRPGPRETSDGDDGDVRTRRQTRRASSTHRHAPGQPMRAHPSSACGALVAVKPGPKLHPDLSLASRDKA